jgi:hypothetical protein
MATIGGANMVRSGLVLELDAASQNSYPGSGTVWTDLSGNNYTGSLVNAPTFNASNGGSIVLNGTTQYTDLGNNNLGVELQNRSGCAWIYQTATPAAVAGIIDKEFDNDGGITNYGGWGFWITSANKMNFWAQGSKDLIDTGTAITNNSWQHISFSYNFATKAVSFYLNGIFTSTITNATIVEKASNTTTLKIGAIRAGVNFFTGRIANAFVYNRALSATEIAQNYNATKSRFNL